MKLLVSWIGTTDGKGLGYKGPIFDIMNEVEFNQAIFLYDYNRHHKLIPSGKFIPNIKNKFPNTYIKARSVRIYNSNDMVSIYNSVYRLLYQNKKADVYINLASGTGRMCGSWLLAIERFKNTISDYREPKIIQTSERRGNVFIHIPEHKEYKEL